MMSLLSSLYEHTKIHLFFYSSFSRFKLLISVLLWIPLILSPWALVLEFLLGTHLRVTLLGHGYLWITNFLYFIIFLLFKSLYTCVSFSRVWVMVLNQGECCTTQMHLWMHEGVSTCPNTWGHYWHLVGRNGDVKYPV